MSAPATGREVVLTGTFLAELLSFEHGLWTARVLDDPASRHVRCQRLDTAPATSGSFASGDTVLVVPIAHGPERYVILGRLSGGDVPDAESESDATAGQCDTPNVILLEATDELTLRVGDGSITIRKDGRILIKGRDLVSHAQRMNRIKGGAVSIN